jgi:hypothetical protein
MSRLWMFVAVGALLVAATDRPAPAEDFPGDSYLRGSLPSEPSQWDGFYVGGHFGDSNLNSDFSDSINSFALSSGTNSTRDSFGGFIGYNTQQWDPQLVLRFELGYNRPSSLKTSSTNSVGGVTATSSYKLFD